MSGGMQSGRADCALAGAQLCAADPKVFNCRTWAALAQGISYRSSRPARRLTTNVCCRKTGSPVTGRRMSGHTRLHRGEAGVGSR